MDTQELYREIAGYLKERGWDVLVMGGCKIQHQPSELPYNYEFVVQFTGSRVEPRSEEPLIPTG